MTGCCDPVEILREYARAVRQDAEQHGLFDGYKMGESDKRRVFCGRVLQELGEAYRAAGDREHWAEEMADVVLTVLSVCDYAGIDIAGHIEQKRLTNIKRPYKHKEG